ncbi:unnamed protein product [Rotaria sp. Silwood1]|nr:unnamed protein product [Rotaria sp. Silwood1]
MNFHSYLHLATTSTPLCTPVDVGYSSSLLTTSSPISLYTCEAYSWTSNKTGIATLAFQFRNDPDYWYVDDVSVSNGSANILINGGFESGSFSSGWTVSLPNGNCTSSGATVSILLPNTGSYSLRDGCVGTANQIAQSFAVTKGQVYVVRFWIQAGGSGSGITASVTLS